MKIELDRKDLCKIMLALTYISYNVENASPEYKRIHDEIEEKVKSFDEKTRR